MIPATPPPTRRRFEDPGVASVVVTRTTSKVSADATMSAGFVSRKSIRTVPLEISSGAIGTEWVSSNDVKTELAFRSQEPLVKFERNTSKFSPPALMFPRTSSVAPGPAMPEMTCTTSSWYAYTVVTMST